VAAAEGELDEARKVWREGRGLGSDIGVELRRMKGFRVLRKAMAVDCGTLQVGGGQNGEILARGLCFAKFGSRLPTHVQEKHEAVPFPSTNSAPLAAVKVSPTNPWRPPRVDRTEGASPLSRRSRDGHVLVGGEEVRQRRQEAPPRRVRVLLFVRRVW
jgi:hypothetical protein